MVLKSLSLTHFRNLSRVDLELGSTTLLVGKNAQGKSNILEGIYFLATTKSPRAERDSQLIKQGEDFCRVEGETEGTKLEIAMQRREGMEGVEKRVKVNGVPKRVTDYLGNLVAIHFAPEDLNLVTGSPALRRWHIDLTLAQIDREYKNALNEYHATLVARNRLLKNIKEGTARVNELDFWTNSLIASGELISGKRRQFFKSLNERVSDLDRVGQLRFFYEESEISADRIREYLGREVAAATSLIGPHRDDFIFKREGTDLAYFGSRGQQRVAVLALKLVELKFVEETTETRPILLLDDVFSELDDAHREYVVEVITGAQVVLSGVELEQIPSKLQKGARVVRVSGGKVNLDGP